MQMWHRPRVTHPLNAMQAGDSSSPAHLAPSTIADAPTMHASTSPAVRGGDMRPQRAGQDDQELSRIRELLVGPYLRDHERRLRGVERQTAELAARPDASSSAPEVGAEWQTDVEVALAALQHSRQEQDQAHAFAIAQLNAQLARERDEREDERRTLELVGNELAQLRLELERERQARDEQAAQQARQIAEVVAQLDHQRDAHVRLHAHQSTELDARLERERQLLAAELRQVRPAPLADAEPLRRLVAEAERALAAMRDERQYLAGLLAELGLHLVRHAGSPAARVDEATQRLVEASDRARSDE
jgi:IgA-specific serine endopeptidase